VQQLLQMLHARYEDPAARGQLLRDALDRNGRDGSTQ